MSGTPGWVEQRLTPEAVQRIRSEFVSTGLFDPGRGGRDVTRDPARCTGSTTNLCVRDGGRLLSRGVVPVSPEEQLLINRLRALPSSLPPTAWADQRIAPYVPSKYAVCFEGRDAPLPGLQTPLDPSPVLKALLARAAALLRGRQANFERVGTCFKVTAGKARVLANEFVNTFGAPRVLGPPNKTKYGFGIEATVNRRQLKGFRISFTQLLPDGQLAFYYPDLA